MSENQTPSKAKLNPKKTEKAKGPIRWNAVIPFLIFVGLIYLYSALFLDTHIRKTLEWAGYKALGSEVNIQSVHSSFWNASIAISGIQLTDADEPNYNSLFIKEVRFSMLWDALLRAKIVINEMAVEGISFHTKRPYPGKVAPPPPPPTDDGKPSAIAQEAERIKDQAIAQAKNQYTENVLGDVASILGGGSSSAQLDKLKESLPSKKMADELQAKLQDRQKNWDEKIKTLPQGKEIQSLGDRLAKVKIKDFKGVDELQKSLQELDSIFKEADTKFKTIDGAQKTLGEDLKKTEEEFKALEAQIKTDVATLETHFKIPKIDAKSLTLAIFKKYTSPYEAKINRYRALAEKYIPPKYLKKLTSKDSKSSDSSSSESANDNLVPHPREKGVSYEFGKLNAYPMFWIKRIGISSQAGVAENSGNVKGEILNISSNQSVTGKPTTLNLEGDFPSMELKGLETHATFDGRPAESIVKFDLSIQSFASGAKSFIDSKEASIGFKKAVGQMKVESQLVDLRKLTFALNSNWSQIDYAIAAESSQLSEMLQNIFKGIPKINLEMTGNGRLPDVNFNIDSNVGAELQRGFEAQIQAKINELRAQLQKAIDDQVGLQKRQIEAQISKAKSQIEGEIKKAQEQLDSQRKQAEGKVEQAKKDTENQAKKKLESEGQKTLDDLKKKFGF